MAPQVKPYDEEFEITLPSLSPTKSKEPTFFPPFAPLEETQQKQTLWLQEQQRRRHKSPNSMPCPTRDIVFSPLDSTPSRKSVSFAPVIKYKTVRHLSEYSPEEIECLFYGDEDLEDIRRDCGETVRRMVEKDGIPEDRYCIRGLEYKTPGGADFRRKNKHRALRVVLEEQRKQIEEGVRNDESISEVYMRSSDKCKRIARFLAARDEEEVKSCGKASRKSKKPKSSRRASTSGSGSSTFELERNHLGESESRISSKDGQRTRASRRASTSSTSTATLSRRVADARPVAPEEPYYMLPTPEKLSCWKTITFSAGDEISFATGSEFDDESETIVAMRPLLPKSS